MKTYAAALGLALVVGACATDEPVDQPTAPETTQLTSPTAAAYSRACGDTMSAAAQVAAEQDANEDVDPAIIACGSMDEFSAALIDHPEALDGADVETWLRNRCASSEDPAVQQSAICQEVAEEPAS